MAHTAGYLPRDISLYEEAFIHKSAFASNAFKRRRYNERLEYLGDAILGAVVADILYRKFPKYEEGMLTKLRSDLVCRRRLNSIAQELEFEQYIQFISSRDLKSTHIPGDTIEAFVAAIYLDAGMKRVFKFVRRCIADDAHIAMTINDAQKNNYKSELLEWGQHEHVEITFETHSANSDGFVSKTIVGGESIGSGTGKTKKQAEQDAAKTTLSNIRFRKGNKQPPTDDTSQSQKDELKC